MALSLELTDAFNCRFFLNRFPVCFNLFVLLSLVTPCLAVAVQLCIKCIPIKEKMKNRLALYLYSYDSRHMTTLF